MPTIVLNNNNFKREIDCFVTLLFEIWKKNWLSRLLQNRNLSIHIFMIVRKDNFSCNFLSHFENVCIFF